MAKDKKTIVGNWKMNFDMQASSLYLHKLSQSVQSHRNVEVVLAPSMIALQSLSLQNSLRQFKLAAQNFYWRDQGAFTGEVSASQLSGIVQYAIVGHSERRYCFHETEKDIRNKVAAAVRSGIQPILCIGETAWERSDGETRDVICDQLLNGLANVTSSDLDKVLIAYEPVWAVNTGKNASPDDVSRAVTAIYDQINHLYGKTSMDTVRVLYGGSVSRESASGYLNLTGVDGLLIGSASLNSNTFSEIIEIAYNSSKENKE